MTRANSHSRRHRAMRVAAIALLPFLLLASAPDRALAQAKTEEETQHRLQKPNYARGGFYIGAEGLYAIENSPVTGTATDNQYISSGGFQLRFGGRHNRWLATEIDVIYIHKFESETEDFLAWGLTIAERLYMTKGRFQPFLTVGAGFLSLRSPSRRTSGSSSSSSGPGPGFAMTFGMGAEMFANENFIITLMSNYQLTIGNIKDHDFLTVGIGIQLF